MMKTLIGVTGSSGFIGSHFVRELETKKIPFIKIQRKNSYFDFPVETPSILFHLAGQTFPQDQAGDFESSLKFDRQVIGYCIENQIPLIFASTAGVYRSSFSPLDETSELGPLRAYPQAKRQTEELILKEEKKLNAIIFRLFNVYGSGQKQEFVIPSLILQAKNNKRIILKQPNSVRDFIHITDVASAFFQVIEQGVPQGVSVYNLGSGQGLSMRELAMKIATRFSSCEIVSKPESYKSTFISNSERFSQDFQWEPKTDLDQGLFNAHFS